ncbi:MAG: LptA/OstA family protein [Candidatus Aminicenantes bacterium]|jgi:lipopolysaccharide transport protein LptA
MAGVIIRVEKVRIQWIKVWKSLVAVAFFSVLTVIAVNLITNTNEQPKIGQDIENTEQEILEQKEQIEFFEARGKKGNLQIRADKHYLGEDDLYHLEGNVEIVFFEKSEGEDVFLYGDEVVYDKEGTRFQFVHGSKVRFKDLNLDVSFLEYLTEERIFKSSYPVHFSSAKLSGSGKGIVYSLKERTLELNEDIHLQLLSDLSPSAPIVLEGDRFSFMKRGKKGKLEGNVRITHNSSWVTSNCVDFKLTADGENIRTMLFTGDVRASLEGIEGSDSSESDKEAMHLYGDRREIQAEEVLVQAFLDCPKIQQVSASENCMFTFRATSGKLTEIKGKSIEFRLNREGALVRFFAYTEAEITESGEAKEMQRSISGDSIAIEDDKNSLVVKGTEGSRARVSTGGADIKAETISISRKTNNMSASGNVQLIFGAAEEGTKTVGFFSESKPVFITTEEMRYFAPQERFNFSGGNKVWQDKDILFADVLNIRRDTGRINAEGHISSTFPYVPKDKEKEERVTITAEAMSYDPERRFVHYKGECILKVENILLKAESVFIHLDREDERIRRVTAVEDVVISQEQYEGQGQRAVFDINKETIVLTGNPVLIAEDQGRTAGTKLTFFIADGKIVVENKGRERSVTVIKS